jgi:hypothetical protein
MMTLTRYLTCILCLAFFFVIIAPVSADIPPRALTSFFILEKNGLPFNESINYTISCSMSPSFKPSDYYSTPGTGDTNPWSYVFRISGHCPSGNCRISKISWYYRQNQKLESKNEEPHFICLLNGSTRNESFTKWNETDTSEFPCNNINEYYDKNVVINGKKGYYNYTPEYLDCSRNLMQSTSYFHYPCEQYLASSSIDQSKGNNTQLKCVEIYNHEIPQCYQYLKEVNVSWTEYQEKICIYRFNLSSDNGTLENIPQSHHTPQKPVESLYCYILQFLGAPC